MGTGAGGIYRGTYGDGWLNAKLYAAAPAARNVGAGQVAAMAVALAAGRTGEEAARPCRAGSHGRVARAGGGRARA